MPFVGQAQAVIDVKQRLALPAKFRSRWNPATDGPTWFCVPWIPDSVLRLYPEKTFNELFASGRVRPSLTPSSDRAELEAILFSATEQLDLDASHRVRLPAWQLEKLEMPREVMILGAGDRLEIRPRDAWDQRFNKGLAAIDALAARLDRERDD